MLVDPCAVQDFLHRVEIDILTSSCSAKLPASYRQRVIRKVKGGRDVGDECSGRCDSATSRP